MANIKQKTLASIPETTSAFIDGKVVQDNGGTRLEIINPADETKICDLIEADGASVNRAVEVARTRFEQGVWSRAPIHLRQEVLHKSAELIRANVAELAALDTLSVGLPYFSSTLGQVHAAAAWFDYFAGLIETTGEELFQQLPNTKTLVTREPVGVAGLYTPWNVPVMVASLKIAAALAMGNSCVFKPSEKSPLGAAKLVTLLQEAGLPEGVVNLVNGRGAMTGSALAAHEHVDLISFTGGEVAGRLISTKASERFAKVTMELGGKSANIIFDDANYDRALDTALLAVYFNNGQGCLAGSRILVQNSIADKFIDDYVDRAKNIKVGDPFKQGTEIGPLVSKEHMTRVLSFLDDVKSQGGQILTTGNGSNEFDKGYYVEPIVVRAANNRSRVCQEEIFGPFATILTFDTEEEAVSIANDTRFGLVAYLWTESLQRALRVSDELKAGTVYVNSFIQRERNAPFGGYKHSGVDREGGKWSLQFFSEAKTTVIPYQESPLPKFGAD